MPLQKLETLFSTSAELKGLSARTRRLRELQTIYFRSAPRRLAEASRVRNFRGGTLLVSAVNAAVAAKLRQLAPTLLASIRKTEAEVTALRIDVQVGGAGYERQPRSRKIPPGPRALPRPRFSYQIQVADDIRGNGDGRVQRGEQVTIYMHLRNTGPGRTYETQANLQNLATGSREDEIEVVRATLQKAEADLSLARETAQRSNQLFAEGDLRFFVNPQTRRHIAFRSGFVMI